IPLAEYGKANAQQHLGRFEEAIEGYRRAIALQPLLSIAHKELNDLLYRLDRSEEFLRSYDDAALLFPEVGELPLEKAKMQFLKEDYDNARENFERAAYLLPASVTPHDGLALIYARQGDFESALRKHDLVLKMEPENAHAWRNFAQTLISAGD